MTSFEFKTAPPRELTICAPLEPRELAEMSAILLRLELEPGDPLLFEGDPARHLFNVTTGAVKIYKTLADGRRQMTGFLFPGDFLGLANDETYAYGATASRTTRPMPMAPPQSQRPGFAVSPATSSRPC
jgi:CRP/FNR family transcriptional regulator